MFFNGDSSTRKRVDLGGRSSKERDRKKLLEQTRLERDRRLWVKQQYAAAVKIQKWFRGRKAVEAEHSTVRVKFHGIYGKFCQNVDRHCFGPDSDFFRQLLFFFNAKNSDDFTILVETCRLLLQNVQDSGDIVSLFAGGDYSTKHALVEYRVKKLAFTCIWAIYQNRKHLKDQLVIMPKDSSITATLLLEAVVLLIDPKLPWACKVVGYLLQRNVFTLFREIVLTGKENMRSDSSIRNASPLERILALVISHVGQKPCICPNIDLQWSFSSQMLTIPLLWQLFPSLKEVFATQGLSQHHINQMAHCMRNNTYVLPKDLSVEYPGYACLLGNMLETTGAALSRADCSFEMAIDIAAVTTFLLEALPPIKSSSPEIRQSSTLDEDDMALPDEMEIVLNKDLEHEIVHAMHSHFLLQLTSVLFGEISMASGSNHGMDDKEVAAIGAACAFLHVAFNTLPVERMMIVLAFRTELVQVLWSFMKQCHENKKWPSLPDQLSYLPGDAPGWLLPLAVFCPVYKYMLMLVDNEEFYEQEKPLSLKDVGCLIVILKRALWQLLWVNPKAHSNSVKNTSAYSGKPTESIKKRVSLVASELLSQLQDWNNRRQFAPSSDFHADVVDDSFISQAVIDGTKANDIMKQAPFLVPFTSRVKIFNSQLLAVRQRQGHHGVFTRNRYRIRRDHILEDAYNQMSALSEEDLRGSIRVSFINEFGVEEAGIDGGGIFKDFMENITQAAFNVQYGLFKETSDHLLYPNPGSGMLHEQHLQFFHFLGTLLAKALHFYCIQLLNPLILVEGSKDFPPIRCVDHALRPAATYLDMPPITKSTAMFEGILVDIPFATFFLSKLKKKYNYLNDLPSLDSELYRHLIFLKRYQGDISDLELYFVIVNNEYGELTEEELLPGGRNQRVTNDNVIPFTHLVSNYRLNYQIRLQSSHFMRGFQQLIKKEWIDMFNEHELQLLISGSLDGLDIDDLRIHSNYGGGYHSEHYVIEMFWEVLKGFSLENQKKILKFVTGCSRGPLLGFKHLEPLFCIQRAGGTASEEALDRLPTSATCMNLLKLPPYRSKEQLSTKLLYAINADAGFDLS